MCKCVHLLNIDKKIENWISTPIGNFGWDVGRPLCVRITQSNGRKPVSLLLKRPFHLLINSWPVLSVMSKQFIYLIPWKGQNNNWRVLVKASGHTGWDESWNKARFTKEKKIFITTTHLPSKALYHFNRLWLFYSLF